MSVTHGTPPSTVAVVGCDTYSDDAVRAAVRRGLDLLGGADRFVYPGERILLKPNLLAGAPPEDAVTTHPVVFGAVAAELGRAGGRLCYGDSPGRDKLRHAVRVSGLDAVARRCGVEMVEFSTGTWLPNTGGSTASDFWVARAVSTCDGIVNLPKLKTHRLTRITGAVKNMYGCIAGRQKTLYHLQYTDVMDFCTLVVELNLRLRPRLHILDGIMAMEGNGPRSGRARPVGVLVMSDDPVAVDATCCRLVALDPQYVPTTLAGHAAGLGQFEEHWMECVGDPLEAFVKPGFRIVRKPVYRNATYAHFNFIKSALLPRLVIDAAKCRRCGACVEACPVPGKALQFDRDGLGLPPIYQYDRCIRCYCCQEICPYGAIDERVPLLGRLFDTARLRGAIPQP